MSIYVRHLYYLLSTVGAERLLTIPLGALIPLKNQPQVTCLLSHREFIAEERSEPWFFADFLFRNISEISTVHPSSGWEHFFHNLKNLVQWENHFLHTSVVDC